MGGGFADAVSSGTSAIYVALRALDLEPFTEVVVGALTDSGGMMPVSLLNCIPVVADTAPGRFAPGPEEISEVIPIDETLRALDDLIRAGKVRYIGTSTFAAWQVIESLWVSKELGLNRFVCEQTPLSYL